MNNITNPLFNIVLFEPRIPQNTGNIARTSAAFKTHLHLIFPLGFSLEDKHLKRAGLDYWPYVSIVRHKNFEAFLKYKSKSSRLIAFSKKGSNLLNSVIFNRGDYLLFGREDNGLPEYATEKSEQIVKIQMPGEEISGKGVRSLNLSSAVAIAAYQALIKLS